MSKVKQYYADEAENQVDQILAHMKSGQIDEDKAKKEMMFIQLLEGLHKDDAELMIAVKEKELNKRYKGLTDAVVKEAFGWNEDYKTA